LVESSGKPSLFVDGDPRPAMKQIKGTSLWIETGTLTTGTFHNFHYIIDATSPHTAPDSYEHTPACRKKS
jgi:hypothetical protein